MYVDSTKLWSEKLYDSEKIKTEFCGFEKYLSKCNQTKLTQNQPISHPQTVTNACFTSLSGMGSCYNSRKNEDAETSPFPKLPLEKHKQIVYNQIRNNQRIFACPMIVTGNLIKFQLRCRLLPIGVGGSRVTFCGDCRDMLRLRIQPKATSKLLTYS